MCQKGEFDCGTETTTCIPRLWVCDGEIECNNGLDESNEACGKQFKFCNNNHLLIILLKLQMLWNVKMLNITALKAILPAFTPQ